MHNAARVQIGDRVGHADETARRLFDGQGPALQTFGQAGALDILHGEVLLTVDFPGLIDVHDMRMA